jgi:hypothetical protein
MSNSTPLPGVTVQAGNVAEFVDGIYGERRDHRLEGALVGAVVGYGIAKKFAGRNKKIKRKGKK